MRVFCVVAEIQEIRSSFSFSEAADNLLGVELARLSCFFFFFFNSNEIPDHTKLSNFKVKKKKNSLFYITFL